jgi:hypothetical protein
MTHYDPQKNGWNRDWETDNVPDDEPVDMSNVHLDTCPRCDMPLDACKCAEGDSDSWADGKRKEKYRRQMLAGADYGGSKL